jgi:hypothetical protein
MNSRVRSFRMAEPLQQLPHPVEAELLGPGTQRGDPGRRRACVSR